MSEATEGQPVFYLNGLPYGIEQADASPAEIRRMSHPPLVAWYAIKVSPRRGALRTVAEHERVALHPGLVLVTEPYPPDEYASLAAEPLLRQLRELEQIVAGFSPEAVPFNDLPTMVRGLGLQRDSQHELKDHLADTARQLTEERDRLRELNSRIIAEERRLLAHVEDMRALYDPDNPEAVEAVARAVMERNEWGTWTPEISARNVLAALAGLVRQETNE